MTQYEVDVCFGPTKQDYDSGVDMQWRHIGSYDRSKDARDNVKSVVGTRLWSRKVTGARVVRISGPEDYPVVDDTFARFSN